ncbi:MAG: histone [Candidatus Lokiarchaeota archaeon]|nr:histone [Candidatus Lokiarchaeota archaeon]
MVKRNRVFAWSPVRALMKDAGAEIVARDAVDTLLYHLEEQAKALTEAALTITKHANRKKITDGDMKLAIDFSQE